MCYGTGKLNHFFESAVGNLELIVRHAFTTSAIPPRSANAQHAIIDGDFDVGRLDAGQIDFHDPAVLGAIDIGGRTPQPTGRPALAIIANHAEVTFKRLAGHTDASIPGTIN